MEQWLLVLDGPRLASWPVTAEHCGGKNFRGDATPGLCQSSKSGGLRAGGEMPFKVVEVKLHSYGSQT